MVWDKIARLLEECDVVIEVLDARFPNETRSRKLEEMVRERGKDLIIVINKCDLVSRRKCEEAKRNIEREGIPVVLFSAKKRWGSRILRNEIRFIGLARGLDEVKAGVVGYANVGKSSLISLLKGKGSAPAAPKPGFTRGLQWIRISRKIKLLDSPGIIPREEGDIRLALKGAYDITKLEDPELAALELIKMLPPKVLEVHYGIEAGKTPEETLEALARKWNLLRKGGELDLDRAARRLLRDWQSGKLKV